MSGEHHRSRPGAYATIVRWCLAGAVLCVLAGVGVHAYTAATSASDPSPVTARRFGFLLCAPVPQRGMFRYRFAWSQAARNHLLGTAQMPALLGQSQAGMEGNVRLRVLAPMGPYTVLALQVEDFRLLDSDPHSRELLAVLPEQVVGATAYLVLHPDGALQSIRFPERTPAGFANFVQRFVGILLHERSAPGDDRDIMKPETTPFGVATTKYEAQGMGQVYRTRVAYTQLAGLPTGSDLASYSQEIVSGGRFTFRDDGMIASFGETESVRLTRSDDAAAMVDESYQFSLQLQEATSADTNGVPEQLASLAAHAPWEATLDKDSERQAIENRLEGLTAPALMDHLRAVAVLGPSAPDQLKFFHRATGYVKLQPEVADAFVDLIHEPQMTYEGRAFALDILASAGNDVAQSALIRSLRDPRTRALPEYFALYQRIALVRAPSDATVDFAQQTFERLHDRAPGDLAEVELRTASIFTLGSVAGHMKDMRRLDAAERICDRLVQAMDGGEGALRTAYIAALGNAGVPGKEPLLLRLSADTERETRVAALNALRKYDTPEARARVVELLAATVGGTPGVDLASQAAALQALMLMTPARADIQRIATAIVSDTLHRDLYGEVIPLFRKGYAPYHDVAAALDAMFARSAQLDNDLQTRIDTLRTELSSQH